MLTDDQYCALIFRCSAGEQSALEELYRQAGPYLNKVAFKILNSEDLSNEALQEAFVQIWKNANTYRSSESKALTWMTSIVRYRALDKLSKEKKHSDRADTSIDEDGYSDYLESANRPENDVMANQDRKLLLECIKTLNERTRKCLVLAYMKGYKRDELASLFDTSTNTIKSWLHRGAAKLKTCIQFKVDNAV